MLYFLWPGYFGLKIPTMFGMIGSKTRDLTSKLRSTRWELKRLIASKRERERVNPHPTHHHHDQHQRYNLSGLADAVLSVALKILLYELSQTNRSMSMAKTLLFCSVTSQRISAKNACAPTLFIYESSGCIIFSSHRSIKTVRSPVTFYPLSLTLLNCNFLLANFNIKKHIQE